MSEQGEPLSQRLGAIIEKLPSTGVTLSHLLDLVGQDGLMILTALLSLVFIIPVSIPGVSTVFGAAILLIAVSRLFGRNLWLPESFRERVISTEKLRPVLQRALKWLHRLEHVSRSQRMVWLTTGKPWQLVNNCALILGAILLMAPFGMIPFSNTLPALALLCLAVGLLQRDGLCILFGHAANVLSILYFTLLIAGGGMMLRQAWEHFAR